MKKSNRNKVLMLVVMGLLVAIGVVLVYFIHLPIFPMVAFLEYDPADIPIYIGTFAFGPWAGLALTIMVSLVQGMTVSAASGPYGIIMHIIATGTVALIAGLIYSTKKTKKTAALGLLIGGAAMVIVMYFANLIVTPMFMGVPVEAVKELMPFILAFNVVKISINAVITYLLYIKLMPVIKRMFNK